MLTELISNVGENYKYLYLLLSVSKASAKRHLSVCVSIGKALVQVSDKRYLFIDWCSRRHSILAQYFAQYFGVVFGTVLGVVRRSPAQFGTVFSCRSLRFLRVLHNNFGGNLYHCVAIVLGYNVT